MARTLLALSLLVALAVPAVASAYRSQFVASPSYPQSELRLDVRGEPRANAIATVRVSGSSAPIVVGPTISQVTLDLFVQVRARFARCERSYGDTLNNLINFPRDVAHIRRGSTVRSGRTFRLDTKYRTGGARKVIFCAYLRYVTDDMAVGALKHDLRRARRR